MTKTSSIVFPILLCTALLFVGACGTAKQTGYLQNYQNLRPGKYVENYWSNSELVRKHQNSRLQLMSINTGKISDQPGVTVEDCKDWVKIGLLKGSKDDVDRVTLESPTRDAQALLEIAITEMTPGSAGGRMLAGEFGLGHAIVQIEGKIVDAQTKEEISLFSDLRRSSGMIGLQDISGDAGPSLVRQMLLEIGVDIMMEIKAEFNFEEIYFGNRT